MRMGRWIAGVGAALVLVTASRATIMGGSSYRVDLTNEKDAAAKATWSSPDRVKISRRGLYRTGDGSSENWVQTVPIGTGVSWRPARSVGVRVRLSPKLQGSKGPDGTVRPPFDADVYLRHSPDMKHWSTWQQVLSAPSYPGDETSNDFVAQVSVPMVERETYVKYLQAYQELDVPWTSDEAAMAAWIVKQEPTFFRDHKPFIGYVQVMVEFGRPKREYLTSIEVSTHFAVSGMHNPPRVEKSDNGRDGPWDFRAE